MKLEPVIGLEIHCQINTRSKLFCFCSTDSFGAVPNSNVCPICMGFPGMLPTLNREAIEKAMQAALALHCSIQLYSKFDRKNYFYPDLPKGFQISQYDQPISRSGFVEISIRGNLQKIRVHRLHIEDDAGKLTHLRDGTLCDYNRSGVPLMEIVSEPDMRSVEEASAYAHEIQRIVRYVESSEADMEKGMMRFDINVSLRPAGREKFGTKVEVKNLNSFRSLEGAIRYEIQRQSERIERGEEIAQETRGWDDEKCVTLSQRSKEEAMDYRYFPEPDLPPLTISKIEIDTIRSQLPELPLARRLRFVTQYQLSESDAELLTQTREMGDYYEEVVRISKDPKKSAAFVCTVLLKHLHELGVDIRHSPVSARHLGELVAAVQSGLVSNNLAKTELFDEMIKSKRSPLLIMKERGLSQLSDTAEIESVCQRVVAANPGPASDVRSGKEKALGFLVGMVMKETGGKANPKMVNDVLKKLLS